MKIEEIEMKIKKYIKVRTNYIGFHHWDEAPDSVSFLRNRHRHNFGIRVLIQVNDADRELEFFTVVKEIDNFFKATFPDQEFGTMSCEQIAEALLCYLLSMYGYDREYKVEVNEDGENSGIVTYEP